MKRFILILFLLAPSLFAQTYRFGWVTDIHIGSGTADAELDSVIQLINSFDDIKFVLASGDIAEKGRNSELEKAKEILDKLNAPYIIIPGNHDTKWSESGLTKFTDLWEDDKFVFEINGDVFIGLNSGIPWRGGGGHVKIEDIDWLKNQLEKYDNEKDIYFVIHHPLNADTDNWYKVSNLLRQYDIKAVLHGHGHVHRVNYNNGIPNIMARSTLSAHQESWGFTLAESTEDSLKFFEVEKDSLLQPLGGIAKNDTLEIPLVDSAKFINYAADSLLWKVELNATMSATPLIYKNKIYTADINGIVSCFDSTGQLLWDYDAYGPVFSKPAAMDDILVVANVRGDLITLNATTGEQIQSIGFDQPITSQLITIEYKGSANLMIPKRSNSKAAVILGTAKGEVYCYDLETLQRYWKNESAKAMVEIQPLYVDEKLIYGSWDTNLYCIDAKSGLLIWKWSPKNNFYYSPAACKPVTDGKKVYITTPDKLLFAIDLKLGTLLWKKQNYDAWESIGISKDKRKLFVKSIHDHLHIVSTVTTNWVQDINIKFGLDTMPCEPIEWNGNVLFGSKNGNIYRIQKDFKFAPVLFMGSARIHTIQNPKDNIFFASNMDGTLVMFTLK